MKNIFRILVLCPFLMATTCDDDFTVFYNNYKVAVTPESHFNINETIWIKGRISSRYYDSALQDSVVNPEPIYAGIGVYKLIDGERTNARSRTSEFTVIQNIGTISIANDCSEAPFSIIPQRSEDGSSDQYYFGIKALKPGSYVLYSSLSFITNANNNLSVFDPYRTPGKPNRLWLGLCGEILKNDIQNDSGHYYFFSVE